MKFKLVSFFVFIFVNFFLTGKNAAEVRITVKIPEWKNEKVLFCSHFNGLIYRQDSLYLSASGEGTFQKEENYDEGIYLLVLNPDKYTDLLLAEDQALSVVINDTTDLIESMQISGANQSEAFLSFTRLIKEKKSLQEEIVNRYQALSEEEKEKTGEQTQKQMNDLNREVEKTQADLIDRYKGRWFGFLLQSQLPVTTGPYPAPKTQEEYDEEFKYQKEHFFDHINLQDLRFWRTDFFPGKIIRYMEKQVEQYPDSLAAAASRLVAKTTGDSLSFQLMMNKLIDFSAQSLIMGMENIWAKLVEDYYHKGLVTWGDSAHWANIEFEYNKLRYNRIGMYAHDMALQDSTGRRFKLYDLAKKYTLLYLYEPSCGHCIETTPKIYEQIYKKYAGKGMDVVAVCINNDKKEWTDFTERHHLEGEHWHNLWDPERESYFWKFYDTSSTPSIYILDENKKIVAKKIDVNSIDLIFNSFFERENQNTSAGQ
ncbi:MAG: TlpA family protein disulfide reductase [Candidatus Symbiothrix sp.]|jgi:peroxiredoxin|nr:TlpA family protein disulfide reductase [Candidatus Symbiothrix sp.]